MSKEDYYKILGVPRDADAAAVKKAYRKLAMEHHPDRNQGNKEIEKKFKEVTEAYEVLKDPQKKAAYDNYGHAAFGGGGGGHRPGPGSGAGGAGSFGNADFEGFADIFSGMFNDVMGGGNKRRPSQSSRGADLSYNLSVSLEEAYHGKKQNIKYTIACKCEICNGSGCKDGHVESTPCLQCGGSGRIRMQQGFFTIEQTCPGCGGSGVKIKNPCHACHGEGRIQRSKTIAVTIPVGVHDGAKIKVIGEGEAGLRGGGSGDLYIFVEVKPHTLYERDGNDLHCAVPIKMIVSALGGSIEIPGIDGTMIKVMIPAGTQNGTMFRIKGKGMPKLKSTQHNHGDMIMHAKIEIPLNLTGKQKELLQEFEEEGKDNSHPQSDSFFSKVKNFWADFTGKEKE